MLLGHHLRELFVEPVRELQVQSLDFHAHFCPSRRRRRYDTKWVKYVLGTMKHRMVSDRAKAARRGRSESVRIPIGDLERIRGLNRKCAGWVDEWDLIREAVRRRLEELGQKYPLSRYPDGAPQPVARRAAPVAL